MIDLLYAETRPLRIYRQTYNRNIVLTDSNLLDGRGNATHRSIVSWAPDVIDEELEEISLLAQVAEQCGVPVELLNRLAALELEIPDINLWGAKAELSRRVTAIIDDQAELERGR